MFFVLTTMLMQSVVLSAQTTSPPTKLTLLPEIHIKVKDTNVVRGASTILFWNASNVTSCAASGGWSGGMPTVGSTIVTPAYNGGTSVTSRYTLTCVGALGYVTRSVSVTATNLATTTTSGTTNTLPIPVLNDSSFNPTAPNIRGARETSTINTDGTEVTSTSSSVIHLTFNRVLTRGMSGSDVYALQVYVADDKTLFNAIPNAYYGSMTEEAVKKFQLRYGVVASPKSSGYGIFGRKTQAKFLEVYNKNSY